MLKHNSIDYDAMLQKALRQVVRDILIRTANYGLEGEHHYYITFATNHPWTELPEYLKEEYPNTMTIVLQYEYWDLEVTADAFAITLSFDDVHERIKVPFLALISFVDPSAKFGLKFGPDSDECDMDKYSEESDGMTSRTNVLSLDDFRKK
ncbi:MAG: ClpXP protease specificity-enhancing factor SspB [Holosporales bacterium]|jgi:hypothetical protein|nr:ClpXP protease specificity-enhancing factor SspB [Holosporales bacterium]